MSLTKLAIRAKNGAKVWLWLRKLIKNKRFTVVSHNGSHKVILNLKFKAYNLSGLV